MSENGLPILQPGAPKPGDRIKMPLMAGNVATVMPRHIDEHGKMEFTATRAPNGQMGVVMERGDFLDATDLVELIRHMIREELALDYERRRVLEGKAPH